jgi:hypothetical protein
VAGELVKDTSTGEGAVVAKKDPPRTNRRSKRGRELSPETNKRKKETARPSLSKKTKDAPPTSKEPVSYIPIRKIKEELVSSSESEKEHGLKTNPPRTRKVKEEPVSEDEEECRDGYPDQLRTKFKDEIFSSLSEDDEELEVGLLCGRGNKSRQSCHSPSKKTLSEDVPFIIDREGDFSPHSSSSSRLSPVVGLELLSKRMQRDAHTSPKKPNPLIGESSGSEGSTVKDGVGCESTDQRDGKSLNSGPEFEFQARVFWVVGSEWYVNSEEHAELETAAGHWTFSDQNVTMTNQVPICLDTNPIGFLLCLLKSYLAGTEYLTKPSPFFGL